MALPPQTDEARKAALEKAGAARRTRAEMKQLLQVGSLTLAEVFERAENDDVIAGTKVAAVISSLPGVGKVKTIRTLEEHNIPDNRRLRGLGVRQKAKLLDLFG
jgi:S13-like H2TH domain